MAIFQTIRTKLLLSFFLLLLITLSMLLLNSWSVERERGVRQITEALQNIALQIQMVKKLERDFFLDETNDSKYYQNQKSEYLFARDRNLNIIRGELGFLKQAKELDSTQLNAQIVLLENKFKEYEAVFQQIEQLILERGFKDYGLEGQMRRCIHEIENASANFGFDLATILMIRRHEKDFMLRKERQYSDKLWKKVEEFKQDIAQKSPTPAVKTRFTDLLEKYREIFVKIVLLDEKIGFTSRTGLKQKLAFISDDVEQATQEINRLALLNAERIQLQNQTTGWIGAGLGIGLFIFLMFYLPQILSRPIRKLSNSIMEVIQNDFDKNTQPLIIKNQDEIGKLSTDFAYMIGKVQDSITKIKQQSQSIERKQQLLVDSLNYARKIQQAILPTHEEISTYLPNHFIVYEPLHTASGDFYWLIKRKGFLFVAVVDCTGHGVPGAFMSMIANTLLNEIILGKKIINPDEILEILDDEVRQALKQAKSGNDDGMDMVICRIEGLKKIEENDLRVVFAGAKNNLYYTQSGELKKIKGTRRSIGGIQKQQEKPFVAHTLTLTRGDNLYLCSDGFTDQPNEARKKFGEKRLVELITKLHSEGIKEQNETFQEVLQTFSTEKRDDITLWGIKL